MPSRTTLRRRLRHAVHAAGVESQAETVYRLLNRTAARDHRDNEHLAVAMAACLGEEANCVDIGAHTGDLLRAMVRCAPRGRHIAFEPLPELAAALARQFPSVDVHAAAVSDETAERQFTFLVSDPMRSNLVAAGAVATPAADAHELTVRTERLDDVLPDDYVPTFIKVDVEGAECAVFRGALETLRRHRPIVVFEHGLGGADRYGSGPDDVWQLLVDDVGLRIYDLDGRGPYSRQEFINVYDRPIWNFLARP